MTAVDDEFDIDLDLWPDDAEDFDPEDGLSDEELTAAGFPDLDEFDDVELKRKTASKSKRGGGAR